MSTRLRQILKQVFFPAWVALIVLIAATIIVHRLEKTKRKCDASRVPDAVHDVFSRQVLLGQLMDRLVVHEANDEHGALALERFGRSNDGGYVVATKALSQADVLLGYGIADDNSFENDFSVRYGKPSYGFDCGATTMGPSNKLFTFVDHCIGNDDYLYRKETSTRKISSFSHQLNMLSLQNKKIFLKMDIEGAEYEAFQDIFRHSDRITGIAIEIHASTVSLMGRAVQLLEALSKDFVLIHVHGNNCCTDSGLYSPNVLGEITPVMELSYIHRSLITDHRIAKNQSHPTPLDQPNLPQRPEAFFTVLPPKKSGN